MESQKLGEIIKSSSKEVEPIFGELGIFKQLVKERVHPLDLIRELLSNAGSSEVGATKIEISYTKDKEGHIFEITDNGCGMNYTDSIDIPGRLDKFLGLGLSGIIGIKSDEFSWKGLGSKLSYQSRRVEIETCFHEPNHSSFDIRINEPWQSIENNKMPKPRVNEHPHQAHGTRIRVIGHPPHRLEQPFGFQEIKKFLLHRTFAGFTRKRAIEPEIHLSVLGRDECIEFGFPEFIHIDFDTFENTGLCLDASNGTLYINMRPKSPKKMNVTVKGFITWNAEKHNLSPDSLNTGLILSVKGIPYFNLKMEEYGVTTIRTARPGENKTCLIVECDAIQDEMNISRSGLVDSEKTLELKRIVTEIFQRIEASNEYLVFRRLPEKQKVEKHTDVLAEEKRVIESGEQKWVTFQKENQTPIVIMREPKNEQEVNAILWKLEMINGLPFEQFDTLAYIGASKGPDMLANFIEEKGSEPQRATVFEIENNFYNYKSHGHVPSQYPKVICWDAPQSGRKVKLNPTPRKHKYTMLYEKEYLVHVYIIKMMEGIKVMTRNELAEIGIKV